MNTIQIVYTYLYIGIYIGIYIVYIFIHLGNSNIIHIKESIAQPMWYVHRQENIW